MDPTVWMTEHSRARDKKPVNTFQSFNAGRRCAKQLLDQKRFAHLLGSVHSHSNFWVKNTFSQIPSLVSLIHVTFTSKSGTNSSRTTAVFIPLTPRNLTALKSLQTSTLRSQRWDDLDKLYLHTMQVRTRNVRVVVREPISLTSAQLTVSQTRSGEYIYIYTPLCLVVCRYFEENFVQSGQELHN